MICRFVKALSGWPLLAAFVWGMVLCGMPMQAWCQVQSYAQQQLAPGYQQAPPPQPMQPPAPGPPVQQQQMPREYAFRPDLTNPQYGECLELESTWQARWHRYAYEYQRAMMMNPKDPIYPQMTWYMHGLKQQLDQSWATFCSKCIYYPTSE